MTDLGEDFPLIDDGQDFGPRCVECGKAESSLVDGRVIYQHRPDLAHKSFWLCPCGAYCGCHPGTTNPLGSPAGPQTRKLRSAVHRRLDPLWQNVKHHRKKRRSQVYQHLSEQLGIPREETHTGMFDAETCIRAIRVLEDFCPPWKASA